MTARATCDIAPAVKVDTLLECGIGTATLDSGESVTVLNLSFSAVRDGTKLLLWDFKGTWFIQSCEC